MSVIPAGQQARRQAFHVMFGFFPVRGGGSLRRTQRILERRIVEDRLTELWSLQSQCFQALAQRDPPVWLRRRDPWRIPDRRELNDRYTLIAARYERAQALARWFNLHPDQAAPKLEPSVRERPKGTRT